MADIKSGEVNELAVVIKTDVHGSFEAIKVALEKLGDDKLKVKILLGAVGPINESDISLATASSALVFGFNVRAIPQARELAKRDNTEIFLMSEEGDWTSMFWRFFPASDSTVDVMISRDTDSRLTEREKEAVDVWLQSKAGFHIMRDHPYHATEIMGGMWGAKKGCIPRMQHMCVEYIKGDFWQVDQNFLKEKIYPLVAPTSYVHDPFFAKVPFPSERKPKEFVGQAFNGDDTVFEPKHGEML